jgi:hypothetical protein
LVGLPAGYLFVGRCAPNSFGWLVLAERLLPCSRRLGAWSASPLAIYL